MHYTPKRSKTLSPTKSHSQWITSVAPVEKKQCIYPSCQEDSKLIAPSFASIIQRHFLTLNQVTTTHFFCVQGIIICYIVISIASPHVLAVESDLKGCSCKRGCLSLRRGCKKKGSHCGPGCQCQSCKNVPLSDSGEPLRTTDAESDDEEEESN